jgi:hypothetical protein
MPPNPNLHSTGWSHLTDRELAEWYADEKTMPLDFLISELSRRGMALKTCTQCFEKRFVYYHDYLCILCRDTENTRLT